MSKPIVKVVMTPNDPDLQAEVEVDGKLVCAVYRDSPIGAVAVGDLLERHTSNSTLLAEGQRVMRDVLAGPKSLRAEALAAARAWLDKVGDGA